MTGEMRATREAIHAGKRAWFSGRHSDDGVLLGAMHPDEWNAHSAAALREVALAEKVIEAARWVDGSTVNMEMSYGHALDRLAEARAALDAARPADTKTGECPCDNTDGGSCVCQ